MDFAAFPLIAAVHTPFTAQGELALDVVEKQAEHLAGLSLDGVFVAGTTGECHSLSLEERFLLAKRWVDVASGSRLKVLIHVGHQSLPEAVALAAQAESLGADGISAMAPSYFKPKSVADLLRFLMPVAAAAPGTPFYYYDIPGMTGLRQNIPELLTQACQKMPTFRGLKYSNEDLAQLQACVQLPGAALEFYFGCDDSLAAAAMLGATGAVGSTYNLCAPWYRAMLSHLQNGDLAAARAMQAGAAEFVRVLAACDYLPASKLAMSVFGVDCGPTRAPLAAVDPAKGAALLASVAALPAVAQSKRAVKEVEQVMIDCGRQPDGVVSG